MNELERTYENTQKLINKTIKNICKQEFHKHSESVESFIMLLIAITKFIMQKQDMVTKNKKKKTLTELYPIDQLNEVVFKGKFKTFDTPIDVSRTLHREKTINILEINPGHETDAAWIIDNIRDSLAHNHFILDYENQSIHIENNKPARKLICDIPFYWIIQSSFLLSPNRMENSNKEFILTPQEEEQKPIITSLKDLIKLQTETPIKNINDIEKIMENIFIYSYKIKLKDELTSEQTQKIKININKIWQSEPKPVEKINNPKYCTDIKYYINKKIEKIKEKYSPYIEKLEQIEISKEKLKKNIEKRIKEINNFYQLDNKLKKRIIIKLLQIEYYNYNYNNLIELGLDTLMSINFGTSNQLAIEYYSKNNLEYITNLFCYKKEKLISLLYLKGVINFALLKEKIYDKNIDYNLFDLSKFEIYDYGTYQKEEKQLLEKKQILKKTLTQIKQNIEKISELEQQEKNNPQTIKKLIQNQKQFLTENKNKLNQLSHEISLLEDQLTYQEKEYYNGYHSSVPSKDFFRHLRNALAHNWIEYDDNTYTNLMNRIVEIKDYNDNGDLTYICRTSYKNWNELLDNSIFLETIKNFEHEKKIKRK